MTKIVVKRRYWVAVLLSLLILISIGFSLRSLHAERYVQSASETIGLGKTQLSQKSISGSLSAYQTFLAAYSGDYGSATSAEKIKIRVYLAATRIMDLVVRNDGGSIDTIAELLAQYGITRTGDYFDTMVITPPPMNNDEKIILPSTAPSSAEALRAFFAGPFLTAVNTSIADMDAAIALCPTTGEGIDREIIAKTLIDAADPTRLDVEMDAGDYYMFRSMLKFMKAYSLICAGYNHDIDIREIAALVNMEAGQEMFKRLLDRYPDFLKISNNTKLNEARLTLIDAITDYETASAKIRSDNSTQPGAEELFSLEPDDEDYYEESLFRENLGKIKTSLQNNTPILLTEERIGTEYFVYGGDSFTTTEPYFWEKGYSPEQYGYTPLGKASTTATFNGQYAYYIIMTKPGNLAPVDTVRGSDGIYLGTNITGNTSQYLNVGGAPDTYYALIGGDSGGDSGGFVVIHPTATITSLTVTLASAPGIAPSEEYGEDRVNLFPIFGNGTAGTQKALRDMLPQLNEYGYAVPGTMGHGLGNSPTLGGILPDYTQNQWTIDEDWLFQPSGPVTIADRTINVQDSVITDWSGINPAFTDITGEVSNPARDIQSLYLAKDATHLYLRIDTAGTISIPGTYDWRQYAVNLRKLPGDQEEMPSDMSIRVFYESWAYPTPKWSANLMMFNNLGYMSFVANLNDIKVFDNHIEMKVLLSQLGSLSGRFLGVSAEGSWDKGDENETCLQIQPVASVTGSLTVPGYDGTGPVRIGVFGYSPDFSTDPQKRLASQAVYPVSGSLPGTYTISGLPVGQKVFVSVFWDRDGNGVVSPGDYTNFYQPFTTVSGVNSQNLTASDAHSTYPAPEFSFVSVYNEKNSVGNWSVLIAASMTGPSPEDVTVTVSGQGVEYTLTPGAWIRNRLGLIYNIRIPWLPNGDYTFTAVDSLGRKTEKIYHYEARYDLPGVTSLTPANGSYTGTTTPTLGWTPPATGGPYAYQVWIMDYANPSNVAWYVSDPISANSFTVPAGVLLPNAPYYWFVRLYDSANHPMNFTMSPVNALYTGAYAASPAYSSVYFSSMPPTGAITSYSNYLEFKLDGVAPWDITAWRFKKGGNLLGSGGAPFFFNRSDSIWLIISSSSSTQMPEGSDYELQIDINRSGTMTLSQTGISCTPQTVGAVDLTSLTPTNNYYFKTATPTFSWGAVNDSGTYNRLRIYEPLGKIPIYTQLWQPWSTTPSATVPDGILKPGGTYLWTVMTKKDTADSSYAFAYTNSEGNPSIRALFKFTIQPALKGDVSGNGDIGLDDAVLALQVTAGLSPGALTGNAVYADVNADGRVGIQEALYVLQSLSGLR